MAGVYTPCRARTPRSIIAPFHYVQLVWAALGSVFGDVPSGWTWLGAAVIIGSGLSIAVKHALR